MLDHALDMLGMMDLGPAPAPHLIERGARVVAPALVVPEHRAAGIGHPGKLGDVVRERRKHVLGRRRNRAV